MEVRNFLCGIFGDHYKKAVINKPKTNNYAYELQELETWIHTFLKREADYESEEQQKDDRDGRIGYKKVNLRIRTQYGTVTMNDARTSIIAQSNIATVCGDCVVCRGKWMYEVQLKSRGSMRLGWLKHGQKCTTDKGVGDVYGSYGFDGNQKRLATSGSIRMYGETWHTGDLIGVLINFPNQTVEYYMNGRSFGSVGIDNVQFLYPAVTLTKFESIYVNFGREPFCYPVKGYEPLQRPTLARIKQGQYFIAWLGATLEIMDKSNLKTKLNDISMGSLINEVLKILEIFFTELIHDNYIMTYNVIPFILNLISVKHSTRQVMHFLNFLWDFMNTDTLVITLKTIFERLRLSFREAAVNLDYMEQKNALIIIRELLKHRSTRLFSLKYIFFDRCDFGYFFHVKPLDDYCMAKEIPEVWWVKKDLWLEKKKKIYDARGKKMFDSLSEIENIQNNIISLLMINTDGNATEPSTRTIFMTELRDFSVIQKFSSHLGLNLDMPPPVALTTFFKLLIMFDNLTYGMSIEDMLPNHVFYDESISYDFCDRLGGLEDYLHTTLRNEIQLAYKKLPSPVPPRRAIEPSDFTRNSEERRLSNSPIISIVPPTNPDQITTKISYQMEDEREKFFMSPFKPGSATANRSILDRTRNLPPLSSNLQTLNVQPRASAAGRIGLRIIPESGPRDSNIIPHLHPSFNINANTMPSSSRSSSTRLITQISNSIIHNDNLNTTDANAAITALQARSANTAAGTSGAAGQNALITINENITEPIAVGSSLPLLSPSRDLMASSHNNSILSTNILEPPPTTAGMFPTGNDFVIIALRDLLPVRNVTSDTNLIEELIKLPNGRSHGVLDEQRSNIELFDVILFLFLIVAKRQIQKIAEIYLRFDCHEASWNELKIQEKTLSSRRNSTKSDSLPVGMDPFDMNALAEDPLTNNSGEYEMPKKWKFILGHRSSQKVPTTSTNQTYERSNTDPKYSTAITMEILNSAIAGHEKILNELSRDKLWVRNVVLTPDRVKRMFRLLNRLSELLIYESKKGQLFSFLPDFYLLVVESLTTGLYIHLPIVYNLELEFSTESRSALEQVILLLTHLHGDGRLVKEDCKDALDRVFANLVHTKFTLQALEMAPVNSRVRLVMNLIKSYQVKRNVAANWILTRFWHGSGFAFRYSRTPNTAPTVNKWMHLNITYSLSNLEPNQSLCFQETLSRTLQLNINEATHFFNNILNNMNWACSEFLNMLQEVKQVAVKKEPVIVEPHTLHLISACFDFAVGMIRVIEMTITITNGNIIRNDTQNNDVLISRLMQTTCLTLARLTDIKGCFRIFLDMEMASAETIQSFPIISALVGVLIAIFNSEIDNFNKGILEEPPKFTEMLYKDCRDHIDALENVISSNSDFRLINNPLYDDFINKVEQKQLLSFIKMVSHFRHALSNVALPDEENICTICYSNTKDVYFEPCRHESCLICVKQLLLESRNCCFCKTPITNVFKLSGELIPELSDKEQAEQPTSTHYADNDYDLY